MSEQAATVHKIAIIGSGPSGLSAACRAAETGTSHVLLEGKPHLSDTVYQFQKGKHVMAEPSWLPLRASARFEAGSREKILAAWAEDAVQKGVNVRYRAEVAKIVKETESFCLTLKSGEVVLAETVVLCIGVQGNPNRMKIPGEDRTHVQYQLTDPKEYSDEVIVVVVVDAALPSDDATPLTNMYAGQFSVCTRERGRTRNAETDARLKESRRASEQLCAQRCARCLQRKVERAASNDIVS